MSDVLAEICADKREHVARRKAERPLGDARGRARAAVSRRAASPSAWRRESRRAATA